MRFISRQKRASGHPPHARFFFLPAAPVVEPHVVMVVATSIVISVAMVAVVMVQMVAAAAHKTDYY